MKVYVAFCQAKNIDEYIFVFRNRGDAIERAKNFMRDHAAHQNLLLVCVDSSDTFRMWYEPDSDFAYVVEREVYEELYE